MLDSASQHPSWRLAESAGVVVITADRLGRTPGLRHGFSTARGFGEAPFDLGSSDSRDRLIQERRSRFLAAVGLADQRLAAPRQVHGAAVVRACDLDPRLPPEADAVVALAGDRPRRALGVRTADCVPVLLAAADGSAIAAIHAGWRGTAAGVVRRAVERLATLGVAPRGLRAALGPAIGGCCYEVSSDVVRAVSRAAEVAESRICSLSGCGRPMLDLPRANVLQLRAAGLPPEAIESGAWCTACSADRFFSYRRQGASAGRMMACIGWEAPGPSQGPP